MLHRLRQSGARLGGLLTPLLLFAWLISFCGSCMALGQTVEEPPVMAHCHQPEPAAHDCCDSMDPCFGSGCDEASQTIAPVSTTDTGTSLFKWLALMPADWTASEPPVLSRQRELYISPGWSLASAPLYLQNCSFLN